GAVGGRRGGGWGGDGEGREPAKQSRGGWLARRVVRAGSGAVGGVVGRCPARGSAGVVPRDGVAASTKLSRAQRAARASACPRWDSNPDRAGFESAASANWATGATQSVASRDRYASGGGTPAEATGSTGVARDGRPCPPRPHRRGRGTDPPRPEGDARGGGLCCRGRSRGRRAGRAAGRGTAPRPGDPRREDAAGGRHRRGGGDRQAADRPSDHTHRVQPA